MATGRLATSAGGMGWCAGRRGSAAGGLGSEEGGFVKEKHGGRGGERATLYTGFGTGIGTAAGAGLVFPLGPAAPAIGAVADRLIGFAEIGRVHV